MDTSRTNQAVAMAPNQNTYQSIYRTVIFFDLDGTLIDGPFRPVVLPAILEELAVSGLEPAALRQLLFEENYRRQADPAYPPTQAMDWDDIFQAIGQRLGIPVKTNAERLIQTHAGPPYAVLHPGVREALQALVMPERAMVLATKGLRKYQQPILEALGILPYFDAILTPDTHQALKSSRAFYGNWPQQATLTLMVGDYYTDDVLPAHAFGFEPVWKPANLPEQLHSLDPMARAKAYPYANGQSVRPAAIIHSLVELVKVVQDLEMAFHKN
ncbi:MAG: HAD family hydrolase [Anaerolineae bacterium]|jgi:FMN phosphatase YigB (HAD superfamily)|nr:HAD family hydrolase [Anaerolineae bacterium]